MPDLDELRRRARHAESAGEDQQALDLYREALRREREESSIHELDPGLYLRIADLQFRLGKPQAALDAYMQASEEYARQGLIPNAIAVCNKVLRIFPYRSECYRILAELQQEIGLVAEARDNLIRYLEAMREDDRIDAALSAARRFLETTPDQDVCVAVAALLSEQERRDEAMELLREVWEERTGLRQPAGRIEEVARELDPEVDLSGWTPTWPPRQRETGAESTPAGTAAARWAEDAVGTATMAPGGGDGPVGDVGDVGVPPRSTNGGGADEPGEGEAPVATGRGPVRLRPPGRGSGERPPEAGAGATEAGSTGSAASSEAVEGDRPGGAGGAPPEGRGTGDTGTGEMDVRTESKGAAEATRPADAEAGGAGSELRRGLELVEELLAVAPDHPELWRRKLAYARRLEDASLEADALLGLGGVLADRGAGRAARLLFDAVLERVDPGNERAAAALRELDRREVAEIRAAPAPDTAGRTAPDPAANERLRRRVRAALRDSTRELAWLHAAADVLQAEGSEGGGLPPVEAHEYLGRYLLARGRPAEAAEHLAEALAHAPAGARAPRELLYQLGLAWRRAGDESRARECFDRLADEDADFRRAWTALAGRDAAD